MSRSDEREREASLILPRQSRTHRHRASFSELSDDRVEFESIERRRPRPRIGAKDRTERNTNLRMISGVVSNDDTVCDVLVGEEATVCRISPI